MLKLYTNNNNLIISNIIHYFFYFIEYLVFINTKILEEIFKNKRLLSQFYNKDNIIKITQILFIVIMLPESVESVGSFPYTLFE